MINLEHEPINPIEHPKHKSLEELENLAEKRHFNERPTDNPDREKEDIKEENEIREEVKHFSHENKVDSVTTKVSERTPHEKAERVKRIVTNVVDFVPVVGSAKMIVEGIRGKQYGTEKEIHGASRALHTVSGAVFLALDATGIGAIASELGKGVIKLGERAVVRSMEEKLALEAIEKEGAKLGARGEERINKKEKIANS